MNNHLVIVTLLPIVFMMHEFEEIIFFKWWSRKNEQLLRNKYPRISARFDSISTAGFSVAVAEEFILLCAITFGCVFLNGYYLWLAVFMGFSLHLLIHIAQWLVFRRYIPAIVTSFLALLYSVYVLRVIIYQNIFDISEIIIWSVAGIVLVGGNLLLAHKIAFAFEKKFEIDNK